MLKEVAVPSAPQLPLRLERGKLCEELAQEIMTIYHKSKYSGLALQEIRQECSILGLWNRTESLSAEDKETFMHPGTWGPGYANLLLGKLFALHNRNIAPPTVNTWRKEYRDYTRW